MNKEAVLRRAVECWNAGDLDSYLKMYSEDVVLHGYGREPIGKKDAAAFYREMMNSLPDSIVHLDDLIDVDDRLVIRYRQTGRHDSQFMGIPPTGRDYSLPGICIDRHADGHVVERYSVAEMTAVFEQIGEWPR
jgi:steroid delta-isomerase-like uncharacterized protein